MPYKSNDVVVSYVVQADGKTPGSEKVDGALDEGYRVVDIITSAITPGGGNIAATSVTVLLSKPGVGGDWYRPHIKAH
jgi:hypothetical protein